MGPWQPSVPHELIKLSACRWAVRCFCPSSKTRVRITSENVVWHHSKKHVQKYSESRMAVSRCATAAKRGTDVFSTVSRESKPNTIATMYLQSTTRSLGLSHLLRLCRAVCDSTSGQRSELYTPTSHMSLQRKHLSSSPFYVNGVQLHAHQPIDVH